jgi:hypothetical protein
VFCVNLSRCVVSEKWSTASGFQVKVLSEGSSILLRFLGQRILKLWIGTGVLDFNVIM